MTDRGWIGPIVERVVTQVLESHTAQLREEIVRRVREEIAAQPASEEPAPAASTNSIDLARAVADIQLGTSQKEILKALLDGCAHHAARVVLFVVKGSSVSGWQSRGFASNDAIKDFGLDIHATAGKGDVGFCNTWTLEISVKQPVRVYHGMPIGQLIYFEVSGPIGTSYGAKRSAKYSQRSDRPVESMMWKNFDKQP